MGLIDKARRRRYRGRLVLWGGRRYDVQVGSERDRASVRIRAFFARDRVGTAALRSTTGGFAGLLARSVTDSGRTMADVSLEDLRRTAYGR